MISPPRPLARRVAAIEPFRVMELLARARELEARGVDVVHLEIGEPDQGAPRAVVEAAVRALEAGETHYTTALGLPALRAAIAADYRTRYGIELSPARVVVTPGASGALELLVALLVNPGERVLLTEPGYPGYRHLVRLVDGVPVAVPLDEAGFVLDRALLERHWGDPTVAVLLGSPANPTGAVLDRDTLGAVAELTRERGARLIVDEVYQGLVYDAPELSALSLGDDVFVMNSFSKRFGMTGWRLGWLVAPAAYVPAIERLAQNLFIAPTTVSQHGAVAAFSPEVASELEARRLEYRARRDLLFEGLAALGLGIPAAPAGAFYVYAECSAFTDDSYRFALELLDTAHVAVTPGRDFGGAAPERHLRFSYATSRERIAEGLARLRRFIRGR